ncbi:hypothetical protein HID58_025623, partial [Brassica napus]
TKPIWNTLSVSIGRCPSTVQVRLLRFWEARNVRWRRIHGSGLLLLDSQKNSRKQCSVRSQATTLIYKNVEAYQVVDCKWKQKDFGNFVKLNYRSRGSRLLAIKTLNWIGLSWQHL